MMSKFLRIGIIADYSPTSRYHKATADSLAHAGELLGTKVESIWLDTDKLDSDSAEEEMLHTCDGLWGGTGSPYRSMEGALRSIRFAREQRWPFIGTWGGFQHTLVEYARNVLGLMDADHEESSPNASLLLINKLSCSLVGQERVVRFRPDSQAHRIYGKDSAVEVFACNYGLNENFRNDIVNSDLQITGFDEDGTARIVELPGHRFFIATLFVPQVLSAPASPHPLITAFLQEANAFSRERVGS